MTDSMLPQLRGEADARSTSERHAENKGRLAMCGQRYTTTGVGTFEFNKRINFGMMFVRKPFMSYGTEADPDDMREQMGIGEGEELPLISATGFVTDWDVTPQGMYVGAWVGVSVICTEPDIGGGDSGFMLDSIDTLSFVFQHHFSFQEVALKVVNPGQEQSAPAIEPGDSD